MKPHTKFQFTQFFSFSFSLFPFFFLLSSLFFSHSPSYSQPVTFRHTYGGPANDHGRAVKQTFDGGYIVAGSTGSFGYGNSDVYVIKLDSLGIKQWSNVYGGTNIEWGYGIVQTPDSGYVICGYTNSLGAGGYDAYLIKTDSVGNLLWQKTYGGTDWDFAYSIQQTADSGFIIAGETYSSGNGNNDVYLIKTNSNGDTLWTKTYGGSNSDYAKAVKQTFDGGYIIAGATSSYGAGKTDVYLIKTNSVGDTVWTRTFGDTLEDVGNDVIQTFDTGYVIATTEETSNGINKWKRAEIINLTSSGDSIVWKEPLGQTGSDTEILSIKQLADTNIILCGYAILSFAGGGKDILFTLLNIGGWTMNLGTAGALNDEIGFSIDACNDNGYILCGSTESYGMGYNDVIVIKTDSIGNSDTAFTFFSDSIATNISPIKSDGKFIIYPNPANDRVIIDINENRETQFFIYDLFGKKVKEFYYIQSMPFRINTTDLPNGIYFYKIQNYDNIINGKLLISH